MSGGVGLVLVAALIAANGVFVAAEFALVAVRRPSIDQLAASGSWRARAVRRELGELSYALSVAQFGITLTSLLVGFLAERAIGDTVIRPVLSLMGLPESWSVAVAVAGALLASTTVQVVIGELVPKNLALARPLGVALALAPVTRVFGRALWPVVRVFDRAAAKVARAVFRIEIVEELDTARSLDELSRIIMASGDEGSLSESQAELLGRAVGLGDTRVIEVMVPAPDVAWIAESSSLDALRARAEATGHSRFPVRGDDGGVLGTVHVKDLLGVAPAERATTPVGEVTSDALVVPETAPLRQLLGQLRRGHRTFAVVVDEHGTVAGIVTLEDVLERLVGAIEDEFDVEDRPIRRQGAGRHLVAGSLRLEALERDLGVSLPRGEYETVAGFVIDRLGTLPEPGQAVEVDGVTLVVVRIDGTRVVDIAVERTDAAEQT